MPLRSRGRSEQRNGFGFGTMMGVGDSGKNSLSGVVERGTQLGLRRERGGSRDRGLNNASKEFSYEGEEGR